jgi:hypothetical protein
VAVNVPDTVKLTAVAVPVKTAPEASALEVIAEAILSNSVLSSVPLTSFEGLPDARLSLVAKFVLFT